MRWDAVGQGWLGWDGMRWDEMGWNGTARDGEVDLGGTGWVGI